MAQQHFITTAKAVLNKSPLSKPLARRLRCLHPDARGKSRSKGDILAVARELPVDVRLDLLANEWALMEVEGGVEEKSRNDQ